MVRGTCSVAGSAAREPGAFPPTREEGVRRQWKHGVFSCKRRAELAAAGAASVPGRAGGAPPACGHPPQPAVSSRSFLSTRYHRRWLPPAHPYRGGLCRSHSAFIPLAPSPAPLRAGRAGSQLSRAGRRLPACLPPQPTAERRSVAQRCSGHRRSSSKGKRRAGPSSRRMAPGLLGTWPRGPVVATVPARASRSPHLAGRPTAGGGCRGKSPVNEAKRASSGACWGLGWWPRDAVGTLQTPERGGR